MLQVYDKRTLQNCKSILELAISNDLNITDLLSAVESAVSTDIRIYTEDYICPDCKKRLKYCSLTNSWSCKCGYSKYNKTTSVK